MAAPQASASTDARLRASEACCALFIERGTTALTIAEISNEIGISERTFYRYFAIKAESIAPVFDWTTRTFDDVIATAPPAAPVREVLQQGWRAMLGGTNDARTRLLFPLVFADPEMWSVFLRKVHDGERALTPLLAPRLGLETDDVRARAASAAVASATRIVLEEMVIRGADPEESFLRLVDAFDGSLLTANPPGS